MDKVVKTFAWIIVGWILLALTIIVIGIVWALGAAILKWLFLF